MIFASVLHHHDARRERRISRQSKSSRSNTPAEDDDEAREEEEEAGEDELEESDNDQEYRPRGAALGGTSGSQLWCARYPRLCHLYVTPSAIRESRPRIQHPS